MPSHLFADRPAPQPPQRETVDALITRTRRLRGDVDAVRRESVMDDDEVQGRWHRALCDLAVHHLDDLGAHLGQLKEGFPAEAAEELAAELAGYGAQDGATDDAPAASLLSRVGSAEWNLLTDEASWSEELFQIFGRSPRAVRCRWTSCPPCSSPRTSRC